MATEDSRALRPRRAAIAGRHPLRRRTHRSSLRAGLHQYPACRQRGVTNRRCHSMSSAGRQASRAEGCRVHPCRSGRPTARSRGMPGRCRSCHMPATPPATGARLRLGLQWRRRGVGGVATAGVPACNTSPNRCCRPAQTWASCHRGTRRRCTSPVPLLKHRDKPTECLSNLREEGLVLRLLVTHRSWDARTVFTIRHHQGHLLKISNSRGHSSNLRSEHLHRSRNDDPVEVRR